MTKKSWILSIILGIVLGVIGGRYSLVGEDTLLNRKVWLVNQVKNSDEVTAWIDEETGIILKYTQKTDGNLFEEMTFTKFVVNSAIDGSLFALPSDVVSQ